MPHQPASPRSERSSEISRPRPEEDPARSRWIERRTRPWFAAAKDAGLLDLALEFAERGRTDPRTLSRASRDFLNDDAKFSLKVGRLALQRILEGHGYEFTGSDVLDAFDRYMAAAQTLGVDSQARADALSMATQHAGVAGDILIRRCSIEPPERTEPARTIATERRTWKRRNPTVR